MSKLKFTETVAPSTPAEGKVLVYAKSDGLLYQKDDLGVERPLHQVMDLGAYSLLQRKAAVNAEDDHFDASGSPASKWLPYGVPNTTDWNGLPGWKGWGRTAAGLLSAFIQPFPAGDWSIETEAIWSTQVAAEWGGCGLILTNGTNIASGLAVGLSSGGRASVGLGRLNVCKYTNGAYTSNYLEVLSSTTVLDHLFYKIVKSGTTYSFYTSMNGYTWMFAYSASAATLGVTPTHFGLFMRDWVAPSYFNYFLRY
jgi:hypothetical protein